ncbi:hypothetical protein EV2_044406 [Malus domestica]
MYTEDETVVGIYVKVSTEGAPYLRKIRNKDSRTGATWFDAPSPSSLLSIWLKVMTPLLCDEVGEGNNRLIKPQKANKVEDPCSPLRSSGKHSCS